MVAPVHATCRHARQLLEPGQSEIDRERLAETLLQRGGH